MKRERLARAQWSRNLGEAEAGELGDVDILRAMGMAAQASAAGDLGVTLWRVKYGGALRELRGLARQLTELMERHERDASVVAGVLAHWLDEVCRVCRGRGYEVQAGTPMLSDVSCWSCGGSGRVELADAGRDAYWLQEQMAAAERAMAAAVMRRLADEMDQAGLRAFGELAGPFDAGRAAYTSEGASEGPVAASAEGPAGERG